MISGTPSDSKVGMSWGSMRMTIPTAPRWRKTLTRKRKRPGSAYDRSHAPSSFNVRSECSFPSMRSRATRAVSWGCRTGRSGMATGINSPCLSTCGGRPGEKMRSLIPSPESSIAAIIAGVSIAGGVSVGGPKS